MNFTEFSESSQNAKAATGTTYSDTVTFPVIIIESAFCLIPLGRYLSPLTTLDRYNTCLEVVIEILFLILYLQLTRHVVFREPTTFGHYHDLLDSAKVILGKHRIGFQQHYYPEK